MLNYYIQSHYVFKSSCIDIFSNCVIIYIYFKKRYSRVPIVCAKSQGLGRARPKPSHDLRLWLSPGFQQAKAASGQAKAGAFGPSRARQITRCDICHRFGHKTEDCFSKKAKDLKRNLKAKEGKGDKKGKKKQKKEEMNQGEEEDDDEHITFSLNEPSEFVFDDSEEGQFFNFDKSDVNNSSEYDTHLLYYDWLGDSATTSHVSNRREAFKTFHPLSGTKVSGVGNIKTEAKGRGTVELMSTYNDKDYILEFENVLYIPTNRNNLISLGRWDKAGGRYTGGGEC